MTGSTLRRPSFGFYCQRGQRFDLSPRIRTAHGVDVAAISRAVKSGRLPSVDENPKEAQAVWGPDQGSWLGRPKVEAVSCCRGRGQRRWGGPPDGWHRNHVHLHPGMVFRISPESCSTSSRNGVRLCPDSPHYGIDLCDPQSGGTHGS